jgi:RNA polymerase sigma-70 factor, ECF subfamily
MALPRSDQTDRPSDAKLAADAARGNPDALAELYARYAKQLLATAYRLLQRREDAEDVVHDVFVGLPEALRRYQERGSLGPWLRTITARTALMRLREQSARAQVELDEASLPTPQRAPDTTLTIEQAVRALSPNLRAVLVLKEIEGFSHAEIAAMLDISVGASEVRLHRALQALRTMLLEDDSR